VILVGRFDAEEFIVIVFVDEVLVDGEFDEA
jgi:hypothetical protein